MIFRGSLVDLRCLRSFDWKRSVAAGDVHLCESPALLWTQGAGAGAASPGTASCGWEGTVSLHCSLRAGVSVVGPEKWHVCL